jgi:hypothetical protein
LRLVLVVGPIYWVGVGVVVWGFVLGLSMCEGVLIPCSLPVLRDYTVVSVNAILYKVLHWVAIAD